MTVETHGRASPLAKYIKNLHNGRAPPFATCQIFCIPQIIIFSIKKNVRNIFILYFIVWGYATLRKHKMQNPQRQQQTQTNSCNCRT